MSEGGDKVLEFEKKKKIWHSPKYIATNNYIVRHYDIINEKADGVQDLSFYYLFIFFLLDFETNYDYGI